MDRLKMVIIIPAHNEESFIGSTLDSLVNQTVLPSEIIVVDDNSTDKTAKIVKRYDQKYPFVRMVSHQSNTKHLPGSKVVRAFYKGFNSISDTQYDVVCKFDADLIFETNYLEKLQSLFLEDPTVGIAGGYCYILKNEKWVLENLTNLDHLRGGLKAYRRACFKAIGGLKKSMGWDTVDELLARYHGWQLGLNMNMRVKHLKPTASTYNKDARSKQGEAFYKMRYGVLLTFIGGLKLALKKKRPLLFIHYLKGYFRAWISKIKPIVTKDQGVFIRNFRWKGIKQKLSIKKIWGS